MAKNNQRVVEAKAAGRVTSNDVAELAGVSQSTVSRAFAAPDKVAEETLERVKAAASKLGYAPNAIARSLITRRTNIVGVVMADITSPFYPYVLEEFTQRLEEIDRHVLLFNASRHQDVDDILPLALQYNVDALIVTSATLSSEMADQCVQRGTPVILFNRYVVGSSASAVCCDNRAGGRLAADVLLDTGHRHLAYLAGQADTSTNTDRKIGFFDRVEERGAMAPLHQPGTYTYESGFEGLQRLMARDDAPDAIFCANDIIALGAMDAARHVLGLNVPEDVAIIGFDDIPAASWPSYALTTIRQPVHRMIDRTLNLLKRHLEKPDLKPAFELVPGDLVQRESVRA
mgnify:FL=1